MERKLAVILSADVVGYSAMMETDEAGTFERLRERQKALFEPEIQNRNGRIFKLMGDGLLAEFGSVVDAVECAVTLQRGMAERNAGLADDQRFDIRIGINLGEVIVADDDRYGEGVNIAARLQALAEPGGICVSEKISSEIGKTLAFHLEPLGEQRVKNIAQPLRCYRLDLGTSSPPRQPVRPAVVQPGRPDKAGIAVLPFNNMSSDPEQEFFADGLAEDLITDLAKIPGLLVIARNSSFVFKHKTVDIRSVAASLGVRYVVEGSVRRAASRIRINAQLIDAGDNVHMWADRFDGDLVDVFTLQDEVVGKIVDALSAALPSIRSMPRKRASNLAAYDLLVRARPLVIEAPHTAQPLLAKSIKLDPGFSETHACMALSYLSSWQHWGEADAMRSLAREEAELAVSLDPDNAAAHAILGHVLDFEQHFDEAEAELSTALKLDPNHPDAWTFLAELSAHQGNPVEGVECMQMALRLDPFPPERRYWILGYIQYAARRYEDAVETLRHESTYGTGSGRILAAALAQLGRMDEARHEAGLFLQKNPTFSVRKWATVQPFRKPADREHFIEGYILAGLPL